VRVLLIQLAHAALLLTPALALTPAQREAAGPVALRVATFNLEDVRTADLLRRDAPRLRSLAEVIQRVRPNVILLNEIAYDTQGGPDVPQGAEPGQNARRFVEHYLTAPQAAGLEPMRFRAFMAPTNTGMPSGFDLDRSGETVAEYPPPSPQQTQAGIAFGGDCWGFGTFPGQYGMALLVDARLEIREEDVRTFRLLPWDYMPGAFLPKDPESGEPWFSEEQLALVRLSSKSHWDVPVALPNGAVLHVLCSHPTPPAFDGPEMRNKRRNYDEIRFWADYLAGEPYIVDDRNRPGGLAWGEPFVILGDLNADPDEGDSFKNPIERLLLTNRHVDASHTPLADVAVEGLEPDDTAGFGLRVDYILPSRGVETSACGVWRNAPSGAAFPSDHFLVWADLRVPPPGPDRP
jgi:endonuclease/exonuclease/phosphatase family metal-dependent hydrolase